MRPTTIKGNASILTSRIILGAILEQLVVRNVPGLELKRPTCSQIPCSELDHRWIRKYCGVDGINQDTAIEENMPAIVREIGVRKYERVSGAMIVTLYRRRRRGVNTRSVPYLLAERQPVELQTGYRGEISVVPAIQVS